MWDLRKISDKKEKSKKLEINPALSLEINREFFLKYKLINLIDKIEKNKNIKTRSSISNLW